MTRWEKKFESGNYIYHINMKDGDGHSLEFEKTFEIKSEEAKKLNEKTVDEKKEVFGSIF